MMPAEGWAKQQDDMIENLPLLTPDAARADRTLARCHESLASRRRRVEAASVQPRSFLIERALVAGVCVVYLIAMAGDLARIYR